MIKLLSDKLYYVTLTVCLFFGFSCISPHSLDSNHPPTTLVLGLDGVGYYVFKKLQDGGHFRNFRSVSPMLASFPSISDPNWALIVKAPPEESFTKEHFDTKSGSVVGSLLDHLS